MKSSEKIGHALEAAVELATARRHRSGRLGRRSLLLLIRQGLGRVHAGARLGARLAPGRGGRQLRRGRERRRPGEGGGGEGRV